MKPQGRADNLIVEEVGDELLVYDSLAHCGHTLSADAAKVWRACDGDTTVKELGKKLGLEGDTVARALDELAACDLLVGAPARAEGPTRREATFKLAKVGAAAFAAPMIISVTAPVAAHAATNCGNKYPGASNCKSSGCIADPCCICCTGGCTRQCRQNEDFPACNSVCPDHIFCGPTVVKCTSQPAPC